MYETRAYDNEHGDPVVVLVATGTHDVSRLANLLNGDSPNTEQRALAAQVTRQVRRRHGGRAALRLLAEHGGPDLLTPVGGTAPMFDVHADVPDIPESGPETAVELAKAYAARTGYAMQYAHATFPPSGSHPDPAAMRRARDHYNLGQYMYGVVHLLRALIKHAPDQADKIASRLWQDWLDGDSGEHLSDWLGAWSISIDDLLTKAHDDARQHLAGLLTADEVAIRQELDAQDARFGEQNHPDGTGLTGDRWAADHARKVCQQAATQGTLTWRHILRQEVNEAIAEHDPNHLADELLQVAAVAVQWRRAIARRAATTPDTETPHEATTDA